MAKKDLCPLICSCLHGNENMVPPQSIKKLVQAIIIDNHKSFNFHQSDSSSMNQAEPKEKAGYQATERHHPTTNTI